MKESNHNGKWFRVTLRFWGDNLLVDEVEKELDIQPDFKGRKGEHINGNPRYARYSTNGWGWWFTSDTTVNFEDQIGSLLELLEPKKRALAKILSSSGIQGELFLGFSSSNGQGGAHFPSSLLARVAALELALNLDLYPPGQAEVETG